MEITRKFKLALGKIIRRFSWPMKSAALRYGSRLVPQNDKGIQILLSMQYEERMRNGLPLPSFEDVGFRVYSQFDEDGILLYIFSLIGATDKRCVEICAGAGFECNTANLIINHAWHGLLFDGDPRNIRMGREFFGKHSDTCLTPPKFVQAWIESGTIDALIKEHGFQGQIDLLSLDLDGVDYWIWKAIDCIQPRVVLLEYHCIWGPDEPFTVPNQRDFQCSDDKPGFAGASLAAFVKLGREKGYRLVGCNRNQLNAFFIRNDIHEDIFPEVSVASCLDHPRITEARRNSYNLVKAQDWVEV